MIYPSHTAENDYSTAGAWLGVDLPVVQVCRIDLHAVPDLVDVGRCQRLAKAAARLAGYGP